MRYDAKTHGRARVIDVEDRREITHVTWADDETGEYERLSIDEKGNIHLNETQDGAARIRGKTGRLVVILAEAHS
jgi:hypothetical protein